MLDIQTFNSPDLGQLRVVDLGGNPYFVGDEAAEALGYAVPRNVVWMHVDECDKQCIKVPSPGRGPQNTVVINESGLYCLVMASRLPSAKRFKRWVTSEVLPSIRLKGAYRLPGVITKDAPVEPQPATPATSSTPTPQDYIAAARLIADCREDRLPTVLNLLRSGGFDVNADGRPADDTRPDERYDFATQLRRVKDHLGLTWDQMSDQFRLNPSVMRKYAYGSLYPGAHRRDKLRAQIEEMLRR